MKQRLSGVVESILEERPGAQELRVIVEQVQGEDVPPASLVRRALNLTALTGRIEPGQPVLLNTLAVEMGLGTGGLDFVVTALNKLSAQSTPPGHIIKLRYTPVQFPVLAIEAPESPYHEAIRRFDSLNDTPVVCAELHSQISGICAAAHWAAAAQNAARPPRIAYIMTDGAALPMALSRTIPWLKERGLISATITAGQAFGGDYESINLYSALTAARTALQADIIVVCQGPGSVGTGTPFGFSGIDQGLAVNAAASLGGIPILAARISFADGRARHQGLSHHTLTVLRHVVRAPALVAMPRLPEAQREHLEESLTTSGMRETHEAIFIEAERGLQALIETGMDVTTMGRTIEEERPFFLSACAAGILAAQLAEPCLV